VNMMKRQTVFLDRDGTIIQDSGYVGDPSKVRLLPGAADAIRRINNAGLLAVVVSNQSGIARGIFTQDDLAAVHSQLEDLLSEHGAKLDAAYYCPFLEGPDAKEDAFRKPSDLRKPKPGMLLQAAREHDIDLAHSWMIGDAIRDVEAGARAGCRTVLLARNTETVSTGIVSDTLVARDLRDAVDIILSEIAPTSPGSSLQNDTVADLAHSAPSKSKESSVDLLRDIRDQLDRANRRERQHDFSILRLFASLLQMFAIVAALWGMLALTGDDGEKATPRLVLACFFQVAAASTFAYDKFR